MSFIGRIFGAIGSLLRGIAGAIRALIPDSDRHHRRTRRPPQ